MFDAVIQSIKSYADLSEKDIKSFTGRLKTVHLNKGELLLNVNAVCQQWAFCVQGSFREYYLNDNLDEITTNLFTENSWVINHSSFTGQLPSKCKIEAFEDSEVVSISIHDLHHLIGESPAFFALGKILEVDSTRPSATATPEEKYLQLLDQNPAIIQRFPLKHIASYLGMTPETLSRVRGKIR